MLELDTTARSVLGDDLPLIDDAVTVEHLLAHRSGIGDYLDEDDEPDVKDYLMPVPVHELATTEQYLAVLDGHPTKFAPGERFAYCNGGYVVLALIAERASGVPFHDLVQQRVCAPAGHGRHRVPALGRAARARRARLPRRSTALADERLPPARARQRRRRDLLDRRRHQRVLASVLRRPDRVRPTGSREMVRPRSDVADGASATASGSGCTQRPTSSCWRATTRACRSGPSHDPTPDSRTRSSRTRPTARGRSAAISETSSPPARAARPGKPDRSA